LFHPKKHEEFWIDFVGYSLSPLIWKKIAYGLSAGRVQSAGLRLLVERERERIRFRKAVYWISKHFLKKKRKVLKPKSFLFKGKRVASGKILMMKLAN